MIRRYLGGGRGGFAVLDVFLALVHLSILNTRSAHTPSPWGTPH